MFAYVRKAAFDLAANLAATRPRRTAALLAAVAPVAASWPMVGHAQQGFRSSSSWTTVVVHAAAAPVGEQVARPGEPLFKQPLTSPRAAVLEAEAPVAPVLFNRGSWPAETKLFGIRSRAGWIYCASAASLDAPDSRSSTSCYRDDDADGRFDVVIGATPPMNGIGMFVTPTAAIKRLKTPIAYHAIPAAEGPQWALGFYWQPIAPPEGTQPPRPSMITLTAEIVSRDAHSSISFPMDYDLSSGRPVEFSHEEARIIVLGFTDDGGLRYRVEQAMAARTIPLRLMIIETVR